MYLPSLFVEHSRESLLQTIRERPLASIIRTGSDGLTADHVPLVVVEEVGGLRLQGHVPLANPIGDDGSDGVAVLVIFHGPQAYISPSWYPAKQEHGRVVPTWNYQVVQVRGQLRVIRDASWIRHQIDALTTQQEASMESPWHVADAPADFTTRLIGQLKGIEIEVQQLIGKTKASQNQPEANRRGVISGLGRLPERRGADMALLVRQSLEGDPG
jgi:transcriptional regulator